MDFVNVSFPNKEIQSKQTGNCKKKKDMFSHFSHIGLTDFKTDGDHLKESTGAGFQRNSQANI